MTVGILNANTVAYICKPL